VLSRRKKTGENGPYGEKPSEGKTAVDGRGTGGKSGSEGREVEKKACFVREGHSVKKEKGRSASEHTS